LVRELDRKTHVNKRAQQAEAKPNDDDGLDGAHCPARAR
jgi:hypothetical protein